MRRRLLTSVAARRRKRLLLAGADDAGPSYALSTFTAGAATGTADGSTAVTLTLTLRDTDNALMPAEAVTFVIGDGLVDADESSLTSDVSTIEDTTGVANLTFVARNAAGVVLPNIQTARIVFAYTGTGETITPTSSATNKNGTYTATFSSTAVEASETISVTVDGVLITDTITMTVTGDAPATLTPEFLSFFSDSTGTSAAAVTDGDKWDDALSPGGLGLEVIASTGLDFPSTNVLRVSAEDTRDGYAWLRVSSLTLLGAADVRNIRFYIRVMLPDDLADFEQHPVQDGNAAGDSNWMFKIMTPSDLDGEWYPRLHCQGGTNFRYEGPVLTKDSVTYRVELQVVYATTTTFRIHARIYDTSGTLLYDDSDFVSDLSPNPTLADNPTNTVVNLASTVGLNAGSNGIGGSPTFPFIQSYQGCFAVVDGLAEGAIIGPFGSVTGEA